MSRRCKGNRAPRCAVLDATRRWSIGKWLKSGGGKCSVEGSPAGTYDVQAEKEYLLPTQAGKVGQALTISDDVRWLARHTSDAARVWGTHHEGTCEWPPNKTSKTGQVILVTDSEGKNLFVNLGKRDELETGASVHVCLTREAVAGDEGEIIGHVKCLGRVIRADDLTAEVDFFE